MKCFKTRESIIRERIDELENQMIKILVSHNWLKREHECDCIDRAINRMFKLINPKK